MAHGSAMLTAKFLSRKAALVGIDGTQLLPAQITLLRELLKIARDLLLTLEEES